MKIEVVVPAEFCPGDSLVVSFLGGRKAVSCDSRHRGQDYEIVLPDDVKPGERVQVKLDEATDSEGDVSGLFSGQEDRDAADSGGEAERDARELHQQRPLQRRCERNVLQRSFHGGTERPAT